MTFSLGCGIDLVSVSRIRDLVREHGEKIKRLLSEKEKKRSGKKISPRKIARILAAKEAYFKALRRPWMGVEGFSRMEVILGRYGNFRVRETCFADSKTPEAQGSFFESGRLLGAQVLIFKAD